MYTFTMAAIKKKAGAFTAKATLEATFRTKKKIAKLALEVITA